MNTLKNLVVRPISDNILDSDAEAVVVTVNTVGAMGKGLALQAAERWGEKVETPYLAACRSGVLEAGAIPTAGNPETCILSPVTMGEWVKVPAAYGFAGMLPQYDHYSRPRQVILAATKADWREDSKMGWIDAILTHLPSVLAAKSIRSIALPLLGGGEGRLDRREVEVAILRFAERNPDLAIQLYALDNSHRLPDGFWRYEIKRLGEGEYAPIPANVKYCGRGGPFGNRVHLNRPGQSFSCPVCAACHTQADRQQALACTETDLRNRLNAADRSFRQQFTEVMTSGMVLGCFCRSNQCHTSVMAEVWSNYRQRVAAAFAAQPAA